MKTTRIEIDTPEYSPQHKFRRLVVNWHRDGVLRTVASSMLEDTAPPEKVAHVLKELAARIERDCLNLTVGPNAQFNKCESARDWESFVDQVNRIDRAIKAGHLCMKFDPSLPDPSPTVPEFQFFGWKVFRR